MFAHSGCPRVGDILINLVINIARFSNVYSSNLLLTSDVLGPEAVVPVALLFAVLFPRICGQLRNPFHPSWWVAP